MAAEDSPRVTFGIKELLARIDSKLETIDTKLDTKVDIREFDLMAKRVESNARRIDEVDRKFTERVAIEAARREESTTTFSKREKIVALGLAALAVMLQVAFLFHPYPSGIH